MNVVAFIPARMAASRFPNKPMAPILGMPMIGHVYLRTRLCPAFQDTYVATCDREIERYIHSLGGQAIMTADTHQRASDRCAEAAEIVEARTGRPIDIVAMIQGDEPLLDPAMFEAPVQVLAADPSLNIANIMTPITSFDELRSPNIVKVVTDRRRRALYMSREPIPHQRGRELRDAYKQTGFIFFRASYLKKYLRLEPTIGEVAESVDMNRVLQHGDAIQMVISNQLVIGVDAPEDIPKVESVLRDDPLFIRIEKERR